MKSTVRDFLLGHFRNRPGMYLGKNHISLLSTFMTGYIIALNNNGINLKSDPFFGPSGSAFFDWYAAKQGYTYSSNWYLTILEECEGSEEQALERFFNLLDEFGIATNINAL